MRQSLFDKTIVTTLAFASVIFAVDLVVPAGIGEWMLYFVVLLFTPRSRRLLYPIFFAALCTLFIGVGFFFPDFSGAPFDLEFGIHRRLIAVFVLWAIAVYLVQRKFSEMQRRESQKRFSAFLNNTSTVAWMKDENFRYVYTNEPFQRFLKKNPDQIHGKTDFDFWPEQIARELRAHDQQVFASDKNLETTETIPDAEGQVHHWLIHKFPFRDAKSHRFVGGMGVDLTGQKHVEEALRNSELRFHSVWNSSADSMRLTDKDGKIVAVNPAYCRLVGLSEAQVVGQLFPTTYKCDLEEVLKLYRERFAHRTIPPLLERTVEFPSGKILELEFSNSFLDFEGQPALCLAIFRDVTGRKQHEDQRLDLERKLLDGQKLESLGVLAGGIAHDFNNLLTGILGNAGLCLIQTSEVSPIRPSLENIEHICLQAADLCKQMLAYSGHGHFIIQKIDLNQLVGEMTQLLKISIAKKVVLKFDLGEKLPAIEADAAQIRQVLMNLIINASEAIGDRNGIISIRTGVTHADHSYLAEAYLSPELPEGDYVYLEVADSGSGMSAATQAKIFDPFFTTKFTGRGLGLAAVLGIVRGHKGALKVYSEPGKGTTFKLLLPCCSAEPTIIEPAKTPSKNWRGSGTILVVDDEEGVRKIAARILELFGFSTLLASDGREGVEMFRAHQGKISAVILDMTMPHLNGEEAFREIRRIRSDARVLLVSGYNEQDATDRFAGKGLDGFLQKPFKPDELRNKLREILEK